MLFLTHQNWWRTRNTHIAGGNIKWCSHWGKVWQSFKKINTEWSYLIPLPNGYPRELKTYVYTKTSMWIFIAALFRTAPNWKQAKYPSTNKIKMWRISIMECYSTKKRNKHATTWMNLQNMLNEKPDTRYHILRSHFYEMPRKGKFIEAENRFVSCPNLEVGREINCKWS